MGSEYEIISEYVDVLKSNLTDPNPDRSQLGKQWIFDELPRSDLGHANYPRIAVTHLNTISNPHELNSYSERANVRLHVVIYVKANVKYGTIKSEELLDNISKSIREVILSEVTHDRFVANVNLFHHFIESVQTIRSDVLVRQLTFKNITKV